MSETTVEKTSFPTPCYVLMNEKNRLGPTISEGTIDNDCLVIYGFSGKTPYVKFEQHSEKKLAPYPLVKGYLANQIAAAEAAGVFDSRSKLVVLDAAGSEEPLLYAATMKAVLNAQEKQLPQLAASHQLSIDTVTSTYQINTII